MTDIDTTPSAAELGSPAILSTVRQGAAIRNVRAVGMVWRRELIRFVRSPTRVVSGLAQPILFLFVLGGGLRPIVDRGGADSLGVNFQEFLFPGVVAMSVLFSSMFGAMSIVWDREFGFLREMLVAPVRRSSLVMGKALGAATVAVIQGLVLLIAVPIVGVSLTPLETLSMIGLLMVMAFSLSSFGIAVASRLHRIESFMMVMNLVANPMLFLSGAIFPLSGLPGWLTVLTRLNPVTYAVDPIRRVVLGDQVALTVGGDPIPIVLEIVLVAGIGAVLLAVAVRSFRRAD